MLLGSGRPWVEGKHDLPRTDTLPYPHLGAACARLLSAAWLGHLLYCESPLSREAAPQLHAPSPALLRTVGLNAVHCCHLGSLAGLAWPPAPAPLRRLGYPVPCRLVLTWGQQVCILMPAGPGGHWAGAGVAGRGRLSCV